MINKLKWGDRPWSYEIGRLIFFALLVAMALMIGWLAAPASGQDAASLKLSELEKTKIQLYQEKAKNLSAEAALIRQAFEKNQQEARSLQTEETLYLDTVCQAHGLTPAQCTLAPGGDALSKKPDPKPLGPPKGPIPPTPAKK